MELLSKEQVFQLLPENCGWEFINNELQKEFTFDNFSKALGFILQVGLISEKHQHHPYLENVYNKVKLKISTHSHQGITQKDIDWILDLDDNVK